MNKQNTNDLKDEYFEVRTPFVQKIFKNRLKVAVELAVIKNESMILDVGCHTGYLLKMIKNQNSSTKCYGVDIDDAVLNPIVDNCDLRKADVKNMPFNDKYFDIVFATDVLEHVDEIDTAVKEIKRVIKSNGVAVLCGPTESWFYQLCRFLYIGKFRYGGHKHTIYDIEKIFESNDFKLIKQKSLPGFPFPELFRISVFKKIE